MATGAIVVVAVLGVAAALRAGGSGSDVEATRAPTDTTSTSEAPTTSTTTTTVAPENEPADFGGGWVTEYATVRGPDGETERDRRLAEVQRNDPDAIVLSSDSFDSIAPGEWVIANPGPWSSGIEAAEPCGPLLDAEDPTCKGRFISGDPRLREIDCYRWEGVFLPSCAFRDVHSIPAGYTGELLYPFGFWLPGPSTVIGDVHEFEEDGPVSSYGESFDLIIHQEGISEDDVIRFLEDPPEPWHLVERIPADESVRAGPGFRLGHSLPCGNHPCTYELVVTLQHPQGSAQLHVSEEYGVTGPWVAVSAVSG